MKKIFKEHVLFGCLCIFFFVYYLYRLFAITPWYDEIYTYINFIDKGWIYAATHWPLPNNHVFFSVLSSFFTAGGIYIGLRGASLLAAMGTLVLLYVFLKRAFSRNMALFGCAAYGSLMLTNTLAVQGRGYSLATFFLMLAVYCGYHISFERALPRYYIFFGVSLYLGLYTLVSSIYWVLPVCICTGAVLLLLRKLKELIRLVLASAAAAILTALSYGILWLNIGAEQISIDMTSGYYGSKTGFLIWEFPRTCLVRGMQFMMQDGNVQSIDRGAFVRDFRFFGRDVTGAFFNSRSMAVWYCFAAAVTIAVILAVWTVIKAKRSKAEIKDRKRFYPMMIASVGPPGVFLVLLVQSVYPFARVMSFMGVFIAVLLCVLVWEAGCLIGKLIGRTKVRIRLSLCIVVCNVLFFLLCIYRLVSPVYNLEYESWDYYAYDAVRQVDWQNRATYLAGDVYAAQQIVYHYVMGEEMLLAEEREAPEVIIVRKTELTGSWPYLISDADLEKYALEDRTVIYENEIYRVYE